MASTRAKSSGSYGFQRSVSPSGRIMSSSSSYAALLPSSFFSTTSPAFSVSSSAFFTQSSSLTETNRYGAVPSVRFSIDSSRSPNRTFPGSPVSSMRDRVVKKPGRVGSPAPRKVCMCSPTTHPGSFRCSLHKKVLSPNRLDARRSSMTNSLVRIGSVEGEWVRRALVALIRPSSHHQRRRVAFEARPSRFSIMSKAEDLDSCKQHPAVLLWITSRRISRISGTSQISTEKKTFFAFTTR